MSIKPCDCKNKYQDERYGQGQRVHTEGQKDSKGNGKHTCTVCGKEKR